MPDDGHWPIEVELVVARAEVAARKPPAWSLASQFSFGLKLLARVVDASLGVASTGARVAADLSLATTEVFGVERRARAESVSGSLRQMHADHGVIARLLHTLHAGQAEDFADSGASKTVPAELLAHLLAHFKIEEKLMSADDYPQLNRSVHSLEHEGLRSVLSFEVSQFDKESNPVKRKAIAELIHVIVSGWMIRHTLVADAKLERFIEEECGIAVGEHTLRFEAGVCDKSASVSPLPVLASPAEELFVLTDANHATLLDRDHAGIIFFVRGLAEVELTVESLQMALGDLIELFDTHFKFEESLARRFRAPEQEAHCEAHTQFFSDVVEHVLALDRRLVVADLNTLRGDIVSFAKNWIEGHIATFDRALIQHIRDSSVAPNRQNPTHAGAQVRKLAA